MTEVQIFACLSGILSSEVTEKCGDALPWDENNILHKLCLANDVTTSLTEGKQYQLEGSWPAMVTVYNEISKFLEHNFGTKANLLSFQGQSLETNVNNDTVDNSISSVITDNEPLNNCTTDIDIQFNENLKVNKPTRQKVPEPIVYSFDKDSFSLHQTPELDAIHDKVVNYIKKQTHATDNKNRNSLRKDEDDNHDINNVKTESFESTETEQNFENNTFQEGETEIPELKIQTRKRKSSRPQKTAKTSASRQQNNKKKFTDTENGQDKKSSKKPSSLKPKKSWSQKLLEDESNTNEIDAENKHENEISLNNVDNDDSEVEDVTHSNGKDSDTEWTPDNEENDNLYSKIKGKNLKITLRKSPNKNVSQKKRSSSEMVKIEESTGNETFACVECSYVSTKKGNLREHVQRMHKDKKWSCDFCDKIFSIQKDLIRHEKSHLGPDLCCDLCGKMYKTRRTFMNHKKSHEENYIKPEFECNVCQKSFSTKYVLNYHVKSEHLGQKKQFLCPTCGKSFTQKNSYIQHANVHLGLKPYQCEHCGKSFAYEKSLKEHRFMHDEVLHFKCDICDKLFRQKSALQIHKKIHKVTKDHLCGVCGKGFTQRQALLRHERIHNGLKPFKCAICSRSFSDASIIRRHMILVHKKDSKEWRGDVICELKGADDYWIEGKKPEGRIKRLPAVNKTNENTAPEEEEVEETENNQMNDSETTNVTTPVSGSQIIEEIINGETTEQHNILNSQRDTVNQSTPDDSYMQQDMYNMSEDQLMKETSMYLRKNPPMLQAAADGHDIMLNESNISQYLQNPQIPAEPSNTMSLEHSFNDTFTSITEHKSNQHSFNPTVRTGNQWTAEPYPFNTMHYLPPFSNYQNH